MLVPGFCQCSSEVVFARLTVKEGQQEEHKQRRQNVKIAFPQQLLLGDGIDCRSSSVVDGLNLLV